MDKVELRGCLKSFHCYFRLWREASLYQREIVFTEPHFDYLSALAGYIFDFSDIL